MEQLTKKSERQLVITRTYNAPVELVFKAFTEAERLAQWWGPKGFRINVAKLELRPGGMFLYNMEAPDGNKMWGKFVYREIVSPDRIVFVNSFCDEYGNNIHNPWLATWPLEVLNTLVLTGNETKTTITLSGGPINATEEEYDTFFSNIASMQEGFKGTFDQLETYLGTFTKGNDTAEMTMTRIINAPLELVWTVWTEQQHLAQWWGPKGFTNPVCEWTPQKGNKILIHMKAPDGIVYPMNGEFLEIDKYKRLVFKSAALDTKGNSLFEILNTVTFTDQGGITKLVLNATVSKIKEVGKQYIAGMQEGWNSSMDKLNPYVQDLDDRSMFITRVFNAPIELVWKVWTEPEHIKNWWGPKGFTNTIHKMEVKTGGTWDFVMHGPDGVDYKNEYIYKEVIPLEKLVLEHISVPKFVQTVLFAKQGDKTMILFSGMFESKAIKEQVIKEVNAREGQKENMDKLDAYLLKF